MLFLHCVSCSIILETLCFFSSSPEWLKSLAICAVVSLVVALFGPPSGCCSFWIALSLCLLHLSTDLRFLPFSTPLRFLPCQPLCGSCLFQPLCGSFETGLRMTSWTVSNQERSGQLEVTCCKMTSSVPLYWAPIKSSYSGVVRLLVDIRLIRS